MSTEHEPTEREALTRIRAANSAGGRSAEELRCAKDHAAESKKAYDTAVQTLRGEGEDTTYPLFDQADSDDA